MRRPKLRFGGRSYFAVKRRDVHAVGDLEQARRIVAALDERTKVAFIEGLGVRADDGEPEADDSRLAEALLASGLLFVRVASMPRPLDAPSIVDLRDLADPMAAPIEPAQEQTPVEAPFVDLIVVSEDDESPLAGVCRLASDRGRELGEAPIHGEHGIRWDTHDSESRFTAQLRALRWWAPEEVATEDAPAVECFEGDPGLFSHNSRVLLPMARADAESLQRPIRSEGVGLLMSLLLAIDRASGSVLIAGHTDATGSDETNDALSAERANNVLMLLRGEHKAWAAANLERSYKVDWQIYLHWVHATLGWDCDPGPLVERSTRASRAALRRFRQRFADRYGGPEPSPTPDQVHDDWVAFAQLLDEALERALSRHGASLAAVRERLVFTSPATLGCGSRWALERPQGRQGASETNRRVDLWVFREEQPDASVQPAGAELYGGEARFDPQTGAVVPDECVGGFELTVHDAHGSPMTNQTVRVLQHGALVQTVISDDSGRVFVDGVSGPCELEIEGFELAVGYGGIDDADDEIVTPAVIDAKGTQGHVC